MICRADCPIRQDTYRKNSDFGLRSCAIILFTDHESIGWRQDFKTFPGPLFLTHFVYITSIETLNGISEL